MDQKSFVEIGENIMPQVNWKEVGAKAREGRILDIRDGD